MKIKTINLLSMDFPTEKKAGIWKTFPRKDSPGIEYSLGKINTGLI